MKIKVNGKEYETVFDSENVQRFETNPVNRYIVDHDYVNLNILGAYYQEGKFKEVDYMEFIMSPCYSVSGFADLFPDAEIKNPLWESKQ